MKIAQEIRAGNVIMHGKDPMVVLKTEYSRGGRNSATVRMKLKSLIGSFGTAAIEQVLHLQAHGGGVAATAAVLGLQHDHRVVALHDDVAGANFLGDFHGACP